MQLIIPNSKFKIQNLQLKPKIKKKSTKENSPLKIQEPKFEIRKQKFLIQNLNSKFENQNSKSN